MIIKGLPKFHSHKEIFDFLVKNEETIFNQARSVMKEADSFSYVPLQLRDSFSVKTNKESLIDKDILKVNAVINTTGILDSHLDVHIKGLWDKSLKENKRIMHVQEHKSNEFNKIISSGEDLKAYVKDYTWKQLGFNFENKTQALVFDSNVRKERNPYMHEQYAKGYVDNHSVGMYYIKLVTCINDEDYPVQKENFDKYEESIVNREALDKTKYFWAVLEAKAIEGSAVPNGSNWATPTTSVKEKSTKESALLKWITS